MKQEILTHKGIFLIQAILSCIDIEKFDVNGESVSGKTKLPAVTYARLGRKR
jgi:hypothetical protein